MINIYFNNKKLILLKDKSYKNQDIEKLKENIEQLNADNSNSEITVPCENEQEALKVLQSLFKEITAAGGVVLNNKGEILFIFRRGKWDLPKGKIEEGETAAIASVREVQEECGLKNLEIIKALNPTYHTYVEDDHTLLKQTYWYLMKTAETDVHPQIQEEITKAEWKTNSDKEEIFNNTFDSIKDVIGEVWQ